jgi:eukaryotic-like serine/threonine-protein kinase
VNHDAVELSPKQVCMQPLTPSDPVTLGPYRLAGCLGKGGMGAVYLGASPTADLFAVKVIKHHLADEPELQARFANEVETLRTITGSRVARLEDADLTGSTPWLSVAYVPGRSLREHVELRGPLETRPAAMIGAQLVDGLRQIHRVGRLHRDLKPGNVMLGERGAIVIDFGLAVLKERTDHLTPAGEPVGTPAYMAPEQARGDDALTEATDVYALGATLVYALTKHSLYPAASAMKTIRRVADPSDMADVSGVPGELTSLIDGMLAYDALTRPSLDEVHVRLLEVVTAGGVSASQVRDEVVRQTYDSSLEVSIPPEMAVPLRDPDDVDMDDPTRLVRQPKRPVKEKIVVTTADVSWLVDEIRTGYARSAAL